MTLGKVIQKYREDNHLSQRQFAMKCGISNGYISMIEKNENPSTGKPLTVSLPILKSIAAAMHLSVDELMRLADGDTLISMNTDKNEQQGEPVYLKHGEVRILAKGFDRMPEEERKKALNLAKILFEKYSSYFEEGADDDDP